MGAFYWQFDVLYDEVFLGTHSFNTSLPKPDK
jgi:hypothetical protein